MVLAGLFALACGAPRTAPPLPAPPPIAPAAADEPEDRPSVVFFDQGDYADAVVEGLAGTAACAECHEAEYQHWLRTPHARALEDAAEPDGSVAVNCRRCHSSLVVSPEADAGRLQLDLQGVGCESCHGPGLAHAESPYPDGSQIIGVRDDCPECNFRSFCQVCHNTEGDPDFKYFNAYRTVRHPETGEDDHHGAIPLEGTGGPACGRHANR